MCTRFYEGIQKGDRRKDFIWRVLNMGNHLEVDWFDDPVLRDYHLHLLTLMYCIETFIFNELSTCAVCHPVCEVMQLTVAACHQVIFVHIAQVI